MGRRHRIVLSAVAVAGWLGSACSGGGGRNDDKPGGSDSMASVWFAVGGVSFAGNSLRVCGHRDLRADAKYRCSSILERGGGHKKPSDGCACFDFDERGGLVEGGREVVVTDLCPSDLVPAADWTFTYAVFESRGCTGARLNDGAHNFTCYDSRDFATKDHPNASVEPLMKGRNVNEIVCVTEPASKSWQFASCAVVSTDGDTSRGRSRYDCGCSPTSPAKPGKSVPKFGVTCRCDGLGAAPAGCEFSPSCEIVCDDD